MARMRIVKPDFFRHEALFEAEVASGLPLRVAFAGLWTVADREGRFRWRPRQIKLDVLPFDTLDFAVVLDALAAHGFIGKYAVEGQALGFIPSWNRHQVVNNREVASTLPRPTDDAYSTRAARVDDVTGTPLVQESVEQEQEQDQEQEQEQEQEQQAPSASSAAPTLKSSPRKLPPTIPSWLPADLWADFVEMRRFLRKPMTHKAITLMFSKLEKLRAAGHDPRGVLEQAIANSWTDVYEPKKDAARPRHNPLHSNDSF